LWAGLYILTGVLLLGAAGTFILLLQTPLGSPVTGFLGWLFSTQSTQTFWYITRSAGLTAYLLFWLSTAWGLAVSSKILDTILHRSFTYDFHEFLSLLAIGFSLLHVAVLLFDRYLPYSLAQILVPFLSPYRPVWVGLGVIGLYLTLLVTVTFYLRSRIGMKAFRGIHLLSLAAYVGVTLHALFAGTDSSLVTVIGLYASTFLATVFLIAYWLFRRFQNNRRKSTPPRTSVGPARRGRGSGGHGWAGMDG